MWLIVAVVVLDTVIALGAMVPCELKNTLAISNRVDAICRLLRRLGTVAEEVESEASLVLLRSALQCHAHCFLVEFERLLSVLDSDHSVIHAVCGDVSLVALGLADGVLGDDLDPVVVGVQSKSDGTHAAVLEALLEGVTGIRDTLAGVLNVVDADADMAETAVLLAIAVVDCVVVVLLGAWRESVELW